jgi:transcriptional regulator with XRE-family HTH domain
VKNGQRELGSKYFGRAVKKWRLTAGLSQEELARRARVSVAVVGTVEREQGHTSGEILCKLCLGLESELGKPILGAVFYDGLEACWTDLLAIDQRLRQEWGLEAAEYEIQQVTEEALEQAVESAFAEVKKCALLWYRALRSRRKEEGWVAAGRADFPPAAPARITDTGKARVRMARQKRKQQRSG